MAVANTIAYYNIVTIMSLQCFIVQAPAVRKDLGGRIFKVQSVHSYPVPGME